jgi:hypothetical protein
MRRPFRVALILPKPDLTLLVCKLRGRGMSEEYEQKAVECLRLARVMRDNTNKALLRQMALAWIERANQIKRKGNHSESAEN